jgi:hypothetical protein
MEQSEAASPTKHTIPLAPVIVLGEQNDYLFIGFTVDQAVEHTRDYLSGAASDGAAPEKDRLGLDELEFFDIAGRRLEPVVVAGRLEDLVVKNYQREIRDRILELARAVELEIEEAEEGDPAFGAEPLTIPDESLGFEEFIREFADENEELSGEVDRIDFGGVDSCNWVRRMWGLC